ncbi:MAG: YcjX family protein [Acetobacteraceae bacterium]|nr:YcjX family protein [Acetobacteraceae bacterium]
MLGWLRDTTRDAARDVWDYGDAAVNETLVRVAVTGLSRAGKTVFITSLVQNLLALGQGRDTLPRLTRLLRTADGGSRLRGVRVVPPGSGDRVVFDYPEKLAELAGETPAWPAPTDGLAFLGLDLLLERPGGFARRFGLRRVRLELMDYPGEWLLDLPLLDLGYADWSRETLQRLRESPRAEACAAFLSLLPDLDPAAPADHALLRRAHQLYREGLMACRTRCGLRFLQPGRFICPGPGAEAPLLWFAPLENIPRRPPRGSAAALMTERFDAYREDMEARFFDSFFSDYSRQVVLVDVLGALHAGRVAFEDTEQALATVARYLPAHGIRRTAFVATKADHVPALRRENLRHLLRILAGWGEVAMPKNHGVHAVASVLATVDGTGQRDGRTVEVVRGVLAGQGELRPYDPGEVPSARPPESFWGDRYFTLPDFVPPRIDPRGETGIPHLGLDAVLAELLGDVL